MRITLLNEPRDPKATSGFLCEEPECNKIGIYLYFFTNKWCRIPQDDRTEIDQVILQLLEKSFEQHWACSDSCFLKRFK